MENRWLGIDYGACFSSAAFMLGGELREVTFGARDITSMPSSVYVDERGSIYIGQEAEKERVKNPSRYLGSREPVKNRLSDKVLEIEGFQVTPLQLVTEVIRKLKKTADDLLRAQGYSSTNAAVITVPAETCINSQSKKQLMKSAAREAGFDRVELLAEPVAVAIYYRWKYGLEDGENILVYDLGGSTFDAALLRREGRHYTYSRPAGKLIGGIEFDDRIYRDLIQRSSPALREILASDHQEQTNVIEQCRDLKHELSYKEESEIKISIGQHFLERYRLTRNDFVEMIKDKIDETIACCEERLPLDSEVVWERVDRVLLSGGSCRIPFIKERLLSKTSRVEAIDNLDLAVCFGAAIYGDEQEIVRVSEHDSEHGSGYRTIAEAVENAAPNSTILIYPGRYQGGFEVTKPLTIVGQGSEHERVIIESQDSPCIWIRTTRVVITSLTIDSRSPMKTPGDLNDSAVYIHKGNVILENCDIASNSGSCISVENSDTSADIRGCHLKTSGEHGCALHFRAGSCGNVGSTDQGKKTVIEGYVFIEYGGNPVFDDCKIQGGNTWGVLTQSNGRGKFINCEINSELLPAVSIKLGSELEFAKCKINGGKSNAILAETSSKGTLIECNIQNASDQFPVIYVGSDGDLELNRNCEVHSSNSIGILVCSNGKGKVKESTISGNSIGIEIGTGGTLTIENCEIKNNQSSGILVDRGGKGEVKSNTIISDNSAQGIKIDTGGALLVEQCEIKNNQLNGILVEQSASLTLLKNSKIYNNVRAGISVRENAEVNIENSKVFQNGKHGLYLFPFTEARISAKDTDFRNNAEGSCNWGTKNKISGDGNKF